MAFVSPTVLAYVEKFEQKRLIQSTENCKIDHKALILTIDYLNFKPGPGVFRVPQKVIKRLDYGKAMINTIRRTINEHTEIPQSDQIVNTWTTREHYSRLTKELKGNQVLQAMISSCILETQTFLKNLNKNECKEEVDASSISNDDTKLFMNTHLP